MARLAINVDHIATLRQARGNVNYPDPVTAAVLAELAGAEGIVVHLREDRRHIQDRDVRLLREVIQTKMILEMASTEEMVGIALDIKPDVVTLVPEKREELTTEGGLDLITHQNEIKKTVDTLQSSGIPVSIFIDADAEQINMAREINTEMIEIHTGHFCDAVTPKDKEDTLFKIVEAVKLGNNLQLGVNAGHGLCTNTIKAFKGLKGIDEFSIGHSIISRAAFVGLENAVKEMLFLVRSL